MKILAIEKEGRLQEKTDPATYAAHDITYVSPLASEDEIIAAGKDAEIVIVDAMGKMSGRVIEGIPNLKMIHSDGVGFQGVDIEVAKEKGIPVCNCKGMNASAVAEQAILLMLGLLRGVVTGDRGVREGNQINIKENYMKTGSLMEIADCTIGLYGFGDIGKYLAKFAGCMGAKILYYDVFRASKEVEEQYNVEYVELDELLAKSDMVSIHIPVTPQTINSINADFLAKMKKGSYLINTARGELVDSQALLGAIKMGHIAGAGLDTIAGEPVQTDNALLDGDPDVMDKLLLSCHIGGITNSSFVRGFKMIWDNVERIEKGEKPNNIVYR